MEYKKIYHLQKFGKPSFITYRTVRGLVLNDALRRIALEYCVHWHRQRIFLYTAVVMPDHVHMLFTTLESSEGAIYSNQQILKNIKGASARAMNLCLARDGHVWQKGYFDTLIRNQEMLKQKVSYIVSNPVKNGLVREANNYPFLWRHWVEGETQG
jgi:putative transposase